MRKIFDIVTFPFQLVGLVALLLMIGKELIKQSSHVHWGGQR